MPPLLLLKTSISRRSASPRDSKEFSPNDTSDADADDEHSVDMAHSSSRPLSVAIPNNQGANCPRRPNLQEILANTSPPPWTLTAFMAYLSQNHCLETLEFTMDAARYRKHYHKMAARSSGGAIASGSKESQYMQSLWMRLMQAYIQPNGTREVNLPSNVRDSLLSQDHLHLAPHPDNLNTAIDKMHELMQESVLVPFLNSYYPQTAAPGSNGSSTEDLTFSSHSYDERGPQRARTGRRIMRHASPNSSDPSPLLSASTPSYVPTPPIPVNTNHRASAPSSISQFARSLSHSARHGFPIPHSTSSHSPTRPLSSLSQQRASQMNTSSHSLDISLDTTMGNAVDNSSPPLPPNLTDDTLSATASTEPMTPPTTPPTCDTGSPSSIGGAPGGRGGNPWKRMRYSFGWKRRPESLSGREQSPNSPQGGRTSGEHS
jgi:Regulator of G protein signaling domain